MMKILLLFIVSFSLSFPAFSVGYIIREAKIGKLKPPPLSDKGDRLDLYLKLEKDGRSFAFIILDHIGNSVPRTLIYYSKDRRYISCEHSHNDDITYHCVNNVKELFEFNTGTRISSQLKSKLFSLIKTIDLNDAEYTETDDEYMKENHTELLKEYKKMVGMAIEP